MRNAEEINIEQKEKHEAIKKREVLMRMKYLECINVRKSILEKFAKFIE